MGLSTDAHLFYGYELTDDCGWLGPEPTGDWWTRRNETGLILEYPEDYDDEGYGLAEAFDNVTDQITDQNGPLRGITISRHQSVDCPIHVLTIVDVWAWRGHPNYLDLTALEQQRTTERWDLRLTAAINWLGITPTVPEARWILASMMG